MSAGAPAPQRRFCTELASERGEPLAGTGALPERILLLRWPRGGWRRRRIAAGMSPELAAALQLALRPFPRHGSCSSLGADPELVQRWEVADVQVRE